MTPSVSELFELQARRTPERVALVHGGVSLTYRGLNARANQLGRYLRRRGLRPESRVVVCAERGFEAIALLLGVIKAGAAYVPVEPTFPEAQIAGILRSAGARTLVTLTPHPAFDAFGGDLVVLGRHAEDIAAEDRGDFEAGAHPDRLFAVLFTSGTAGAPKGILMRASSAANLLAGMGRRFPFQPHDVFLMHRSFTIVGSLWEYFGPLVHGVRGTILSGDDARDPETIWRRIVGEPVTHLIASPTLADAIVRHGQRHGLTSHRLRCAILGGEPVGRGTISGWRRVFPGGGPFICYGITETMYVAFFDTSLLDPLAPEDEVVPVGTPLYDATVRIVDDAMECAGQGAVGEICVSGPRLARGYLNAPRLTAERFVPDPWAAQPGAVLYRTGDLGCWRADGTLELRGRRDRQVKIRGFRVELDELEAVIRRVSNARNAAVVARRDARRQQELIAYIETDAAIEAEDLRRELRRVVPDYMVPARFVPVPRIPLTAGGKLDRRALAAVPFSASAPAAP